MRVQTDHWAVIMDFCEVNPEIITNKFKGPKGRSDLTQKWVELTVLLNSIGQGEKTTEEWKKTLIDWKSKTKAKAVGISTSQGDTGGGPTLGIKLTSFEERLLSIMGKVAVYGNKGVKEVGLKRSLETLGENESNKPSFKNEHKTKIPKTVFLTVSKEQCNPYYNSTLASSTITSREQLITNTCTETPSCYKLSPTAASTSSNFSKTLCKETLTKDESISQLHSVENTLHYTPLNVTVDPIPTPNVSQIPAGCLQPLPNISSPGSASKTLIPKRQNTPTPVIQRSARRRGTTPRISEQLQVMNDNVLEVLQNINSNICQIGTNLKELTNAIKELKK